MSRKRDMQIVRGVIASHRDSRSVGEVNAVAGTGVRHGFVVAWRAAPARSIAAMTQTESR